MHFRKWRIVAWLYFLCSYLCVFFRWTFIWMSVSAFLTFPEIKLKRKTIVETNLIVLWKYERTSERIRENLTNLCKYNFTHFKTFVNSLVKLSCTFGMFCAFSLPNVWEKLNFRTLSYLFGGLVAGSKHDTFFKLALRLLISSIKEPLKIVKKIFYSFQLLMLFFVWLK